MGFQSSIASGFAKMESKLTGQNGSNGNGDFTVDTRSTISSSELLPVTYGKSQQPTSLVVAKLIARTMILITFIVSMLVLLTVYIQANSVRCDYRPMMTQPSRNRPYYEPLTAADSDGNERKIPISIRMSGRAGDLMNSATNGGPDGKPGRVNCLIERKTADQIIASEPKKLSTPFGNITTDPRLIHLTGEKLVFSCHSGEKEENESMEDKEKEIIIISNSRESLKPKQDHAGDVEVEDDNDNLVEHQHKSNSNEREIENNINKINNRPKRSPTGAAAAAALGLKKKECTCNCAC